MTKTKSNIIESETEHSRLCTDRKGGEHDIHKSADEKNIYQSCRVCPWTETAPRS